MSIKKFSIPNTESFPNPYKGVERVNQPITDEQAFIDMFNLITERDYPVSRKYYCVMLFVEESDITCNPQDNGKWINTRNVYFHNGGMALDYYANTPCPASQLIDAETLPELIQARNQMLLNFKDEQFLDNLRESL